MFTEDMPEYVGEKEVNNLAKKQYRIKNPKYVAVPNLQKQDYEVSIIENYEETYQRQFKKL